MRCSKDHRCGCFTPLARLVPMTILGDGVVETRGALPNVCVSRHSPASLEVELILFLADGIWAEVTCPLPTSPPTQLPAKDSKLCPGKEDQMFRELLRRGIHLHPPMEQEMNVYFFSQSTPTGDAGRGGGPSMGGPSGFPGGSAAASGARVSAGAAEQLRAAKPRTRSGPPSPSWAAWSRT